MEFYRLNELYNLEIELVPDGGCKAVDIIEPGTKRFYQSLKTKTLSEEDCSEEFTYSRRSNIFIGLTCDYPYAQLLQQGRYWDTSLTDEIPGSGFPMIGISLRGKSFRYRNGAVEDYTSYKPVPHLMRLGETYYYVIQPIVEMIKEFGWDRVTLVIPGVRMMLAKTTSYGRPNSDSTWTDIMDRTLSLKTELEIQTDVEFKEISLQLISNQTGDNYLSIGDNFGTTYPKQDCETNCIRETLETITDSSRIAIWMFDRKYLEELFTSEELLDYRDFYDELVFSNNTNPSYQHIFFLDNEPNEPFPLEFTNVHFLTNEHVIDQYYDKPPVCSNDPSEVDVSEIIKSSFILESYFNSIGLVKKIFSEVEAEYPHFEFEQIPGTIYADSAANSTFVGYKGDEIAIDEEADQVMATILYSPPLENAQTNRSTRLLRQTAKFFDNSGIEIIPLTILDDEIFSTLLNFNFKEPECGYDGNNLECQPCGGNCFGVIMGIVVGGIGLVIGLVAWCWFTAATRASWEIQASDIIFNPGKYRKGPKIRRADEFVDDDILAEFANRKSKRSTTMIKENAGIVKGIHIPLNPHVPVGIYTKKDLFSKSPAKLVAVKKVRLDQRIDFTKEQQKIAQVRID